MRAGPSNSLGPVSAAGDRSMLSLFRREEALALDDIIVTGQESPSPHFTLYAAGYTETSMMGVEVSVDTSADSVQLTPCETGLIL